MWECCDLCVRFFCFCTLFFRQMYGSFVQMKLFHQIYVVLLSFPVSFVRVAHLGCKHFMWEFYCQLLHYYFHKIVVRLIIKVNSKFWKWNWAVNSLKPFFNTLKDIVFIHNILDTLGIKRMTMEGKKGQWWWRGPLLLDLCVSNPAGSRSLYH